MNILRIKDILCLKVNDQKVEAQGWIRTSRDSKAFGFIEINDGSIIKRIRTGLCLFKRIDFQRRKT